MRAPVPVPIVTKKKPVVAGKRPVVRPAVKRRPVPVQRKPQMQEVMRTVAGMASDRAAAAEARRHGMVVQNVSWEDTARFEGSAVGPNISDMTLQVNGRRMPVIRAPNFSDTTWDVPIDKIELACGNEREGEPLHSVLLQDYLSHFRAYLSEDSTWPGEVNSLLAPERDTHVLMSAQSCFLPVIEGEETKFNVSLYNYNSTRDDPGVLTIVATAAGTSAQVVQNGEEKLYFNKAGQRAPFVSQRLKDNRRERGVQVEGEMSAAEKASNVVMVIQVPLKRRRTRPAFYGYGVPMPMPMPMPMYPPFGGYELCATANGGAGPAMMMGGAAMAQCCAAPAPQMMKCATAPRRVSKRAPEAGIDHAIVKVGQAEGKFKEVAGLAIERDPRFPIRVTLQYYKATDSGQLTRDAIDEIANQIRRAQTHGDFIGSLVVDGLDGVRPTEPELPRPRMRPVPVVYHPHPIEYYAGPADPHMPSFANSFT